jgi:uncharacterized protein (TIGR04222 family)
MSPNAKSLLTAIEAFDIDGLGPSALTFTTRLARENGWSRTFAARVVNEYKRFVYLAMTAGRPVCPSEQVDAAWHLHLTYTRSYWDRFCGEVLGRPLHHHPTRGGTNEADKHRRMYTETLAAYREAFGREPPADIWPPVDVRFGDDLHHVAVNTRHNWVIPKAAVRRAGIVAAAVMLVGVGCGAGGNPFDLKGIAFLTEFFWPLLIAAVILGLVIRWKMKGSVGDELPDLGWAEAAYLAGGPARLVSAAIARAVQGGSAKMADDGSELQRGDAEPTDPLEQEVVNALPLGKDNAAQFRSLSNAIEQRFAEREQELRDDGLLLTPSQRWGMWFLTILPLVVVGLGFGLPRLVMGLMNGKPSGFLFFSLVAAFFAFIIFSTTTPRRTRRGDAALARLQSDPGLLKHARPAEVGGYDAGLAVALFGTAALAGTVYAPLVPWSRRQAELDGGLDSAGGCDGGGGGGAGGCGGGCGGCS